LDFFAEKEEVKPAIIDAKSKFDWDVDRTTLASHLIRTQDFDESSMVLIPFNKQDMDTFFKNLAPSLKKRHF